MTGDLARLAEEHDPTSQGSVVVEQHGDKVVAIFEATAGPYDGTAFAITFSIAGWEKFLRDMLMFEVKVP